MFTRRKKHISALLLTLVMAFTMNSPFLKIYAEAAGAEETGELNTLKEQQEQLAEQKAEFQAEYSEISSELVSQMAKLEYLTSQLDMNSAEIENLSQQIVIYTNSIAEMENQLNSDKQKEQELLERFKARVRVMEENGSYTYLSILFGADSFENMLSRVECIREIMAYDNSIIEDVRETQEKVQAEKQEMESEMADLAILCSEFQEKR
jgi:peptidoglycan hydrolase CwlO-like protein